MKNWKKEFEKNIAPQITDYGGISEDKDLEEYIKQFIQLALLEQKKGIIEWIEGYNCEYCNSDCSCGTLEVSLLKFLEKL